MKSIIHKLQKPNFKTMSKKTILCLSFAFLSLTSCSNDDEENQVIPTPASDGAVLQPTIGGANQPNQVFIDLSTESISAVNRTSWDFGFYSGSDFRVIINGSVKMAVKKLETTDITLPQEIDEDVAVGAGTNASSNGYCDNPNGILNGAGAGLGTAIAEISATDSENKVYLVNLGYTVSTNSPAVGSVSIDGEERGWKKLEL